MSWVEHGELSPALRAPELTTGMQRINTVNKNLTLKRCWRPSCFQAAWEQPHAYLVHSSPPHMNNAATFRTDNNFIRCNSLAALTFLVYDMCMALINRALLAAYILPKIQCWCYLLRCVVNACGRRDNILIPMLPEQVDFVWKQRWSGGKLLYIWVKMIPSLRVLFCD